MPRHFAIVPAAGSGSRFAAAAPKQYLDLAGQPLIAHTLATLCRAPQIARVIVVLAPHDDVWQRHDWSRFGAKLSAQRIGGATRAASVCAGLRHLAAEAAADDWVLVHDAARPCLDAALLNRLLDELADDPVGGILALPVADTIKRADGAGRISRTEPRDHLWQAQTPQMFRYATLLDALTRSTDVTDEASAIEAIGLRPRLITGAVSNLKVTYPADQRLAAAIIAASQGINAPDAAP